MATDNSPRATSPLIPKQITPHGPVTKSLGDLISALRLEAQLEKEEIITQHPSKLKQDLVRLESELHTNKCIVEKLESKLNFLNNFLTTGFGKSTTSMEIAQTLAQVPQLQAQIIDISNKQDLVAVQLDKINRRTTLLSDKLSRSNTNVYLFIVGIVLLGLCIYVILKDQDLTR